MKKILGILGLLIFVCVMTQVFSGRFLTESNIQQLMYRTSLFGIISIGAGFVIMTSGIDLSIGSIVCLTGCLLPCMVANWEWAFWPSLLLVLLLAGLLGLGHGLLITKLKIQPFVVTLCGLLIYRGLARSITQDETQGFGKLIPEIRDWPYQQFHLPGIDFGIPNACLLLLGIAVLAMVFLNLTVYGRYLLALGRNEEATRMSGIKTDRMVILAYVICALLSGVGGVLFVFDTNTAQASNLGNFYELWAIAAAVLGGCSLRGGEGAILGIVIGTAVMQVLKKAIKLIDWIPQESEFAVIGVVILGGVIVDEVVKRMAAARLASRKLS